MRPNALLLCLFGRNWLGVMDFQPDIANSHKICHTIDVSNFRT